MTYSMPELDLLARAVSQAAETAQRWQQRAAELEGRVSLLEKELEELKQVSGNAQAEVKRLQRDKGEIKSRVDRIRKNLATLDMPAHQQPAQKQ